MFSPRAERDAISFARVTIAGSIPLIAAQLNRKSVALRKSSYKHGAKWDVHGTKTLVTTTRTEAIQPVSITSVLQTPKRVSLCILVKIRDLVLEFLRLFANLDFHMAKVKPRSQSKEIVLENLVEMSSCDDLGGAGEIQ
jgi:hypothetical protein